MADLVISPRDLPRQFDDISDFLAQNGVKGLTDADAASMMAAEANINGQSKRKPVRLANYSPDYSKDDWWKADDGWCGFNVNNAIFHGDANGLWDALEGRIDGDLNGWVYELPRGVNAEHNEPFRIRDFEGYYPAAKIVPAWSASSKVNQYVGNYIRFEIAGPNDDHSLSLLDFGNKINDLAPLKDFYLGAIFKQRDRKLVFTADEPISKKMYAEVESTSLVDGEWETFLFLSLNPITPNHDEILSHFVTIPSTGKQVIKIVKSAPIEIELTAVRTNYDIAVNVKITNIVSSPVTLKGNFVELRNPNSNIVDEYDRTKGEQQEALNGGKDITIPVGATYEERIDFLMLGAIFAQNCVAWVTLSGKDFYNSVIPQ